MANRQTSSSSSKKDPTPKQITKTTPAKTPESEFKAKVRKVCDVVGWPAEDVSRVLKESESNVEVAIDKILSGDAGHPGDDWQPSKKKKNKNADDKPAAKASKPISQQGQAARGGNRHKGPRGSYENGQKGGNGGRYTEPHRSRRTDNNQRTQGQRAPSTTTQQPRPGLQSALPQGQAEGETMKESSGEGDASKSHQVAATGFDSGDASQQQQQPAPTIQQIRPVGAAIGAAARSVPNGPSSSLPPSQPSTEKLTAAQVLQGRTAQASVSESKPAGQTQQQTQQPRPQQSSAPPSVAQGAPLKPVTAIQPKGQLPSAAPQAGVSQSVASAPSAPVASAAKPAQPVPTASLPAQQQHPAQQTNAPTVHTQPAYLASGASSAKAPLAPTAASTTSPQPSPVQQQQQGAIPKSSYQGAGSGKGSRRSSGRPSQAQWQPKTNASSPLSSSSQSNLPVPLQPSSAQSIATAKEASHQTGQQAVAAALGAIGQREPVILLSPGLLPSDPEEKKIRFGNFEFEQTSANEDSLLTPSEPKQTQPQQQPQQRRDEPPVGVGRTPAGANPTAPAGGRASGPKEQAAEVAQAVDNTTEPVSRKPSANTGRAGEKRSAASNSAAGQQQPMNPQQLRPIGSNAAAMHTAISPEGYDMSAFTPPLAYPSNHYWGFPMEMGPDSQQMQFYDFPAAGYRAPVSPEPKYGAAPNPQVYRDSGKYPTQMGHQAGSHGNGEAEGSHSGGHSPRGSTQSQSPPPMQQQPPHHFGMPPTHLYGFHPGHYTFPYPSPSFSQAYQYPQRMGPPFKNVPHYPISPPGSSSLGAAGYPDDEYAKAYGMQAAISQQPFYETAGNQSPPMGVKNPHSLSSSSSKNQQASQLGTYSQNSDLSVGATPYKGLGLAVDYSPQDMARGSPSSFYSPQFGQQSQYYGFLPHYQPQHGQPPHQSQSAQLSGSVQNPQYS